MARVIRATVLVCALAVFALAAPAKAWGQSADPENPYQRSLDLFFQGRYAEAEVQARKAVELGESEYGPDNPNTALRLQILAMVYLAQGRDGEAEPLLKRIVVIFEKTLRPDDWDMVNALNMLASLYRSQGIYVEAEPLYKRALAIVERAPKRGPPMFAYEALIGLGAIYLDQGRYAEAEPLFARAVSVQEGKGEGVYLAWSLHWLALLYHAQERFAEAEPLFKRSLKILETVQGSDHPDVAYLFSSLEEHYATQGRHAEASEVAAWVQAKDSREVQDIEKFLRDHPQGHFATRAKRLLATLRPLHRPSTPATPDAQQTAGIDLAPGRTFKDCAECPEMVIVPPGSYQMGSPESDTKALLRAGAKPRWLEHERPQHLVTINYSFAVGKYEVTFAEWDACVTARGCSHRPRDRWGRGSHPVMFVSWSDAKEYLAWLSRKTGKNYSLLTEAEWEYVARAGTATPFHFGSKINTDQANYDGSRAYIAGPTGEHRDKTVPVGRFPANAFGLHDMHGNVAELVEDCWHDSYEGAPSDGRAWGAGECDRHVARGGSRSSSPRHIRSASRAGVSAEYRSSSLGFRVARIVP